MSTQFGDESPEIAPPTDIKLAADNPKRRAGRRKFKETRHPVYRGIRQRNSSKWVCEVREPVNKARVWLGTFPTPEMAARAHDVAVIAFRGRSTCLNFADSASLPVPDSGDIKDIQRAAAEAAEAFGKKPQAEEAVETVAASVNEEGTSGDVDFSYMDEIEDDLFGMQEMIIADMYNGMMLPPPTTVYDDYVECDMDYQLWDF